MFTYDYQGRWVSKTVAFWDEGSSAWAVSSEHYYTYDGWNMVCETTISQISIPPSQVQRIQSFVWGLDLSGTLQGAGGVGGLLASVVDGTIYYSTYDANGNVSEMLDVSGQVTAHYQYGPFGEPITATGTYADENPFRFSTKYTDPETGLLYYGFRYYDPETGRWLSRDPIEEQGGLNLYGFVGNDGVNEWDYLGLQLSSLWEYKKQKVAVVGSIASRGVRSTDLGVTWIENDIKVKCDGQSNRIEISLMIKAESLSRKAIRENALTLFPEVYPKIVSLVTESRLSSNSVLPASIGDHFKSGRIAARAKQHEMDHLNDYDLWQRDVGSKFVNDFTKSGCCCNDKAQIDELSDILETTLSRTNRLTSGFWDHGKGVSAKPDGAGGNTNIPHQILASGNVPGSPTSDEKAAHDRRIRSLYNKTLAKKVRCKE